jgi:hypothetical protein
MASLGDMLLALLVSFKVALPKSVQVVSRLLRRYKDDNSVVADVIFLAILLCNCCPLLSISFWHSVL